MTYYPQNNSGLVYQGTPVGPTVTGITLTANASNNTKGVYAELEDSLPFTCNFANIVFLTTSAAAAGRLFLVDIATGAAASEVVKIANLTCEGTTTASSAYGQGLYLFPIAIASGTRIACRCQCSTGSTTLGQVTASFIAAGGVPGISSFTTYGANTTDSGGTAIDPGGTAHTKGSFVELSASLSEIAQFLGLIVTYGHTSYATCSWAFDIATGAAASEVVLIADIRYSSATNVGATPSLHPRMQTFLTYIAASTRIAVRSSCSINTAGGRIADVIIVTGVAPTESSGGGGNSVFMG